MKKYIALLRGINVGGKCKVPMPILKELFESLGFLNVVTYINTGNVIFESDIDSADEIISLIEKVLHKKFLFKIKVMLRDAKNILNLCKKVPVEWVNDSEQRTDVLFLAPEFDSKKSISLIQSTVVDNLIYINGAIVWNLKRDDYKKSGMRKFIGSELYANMTARNVNTLRRLGEMVVI